MIKIKKSYFITADNARPGLFASTALIKDNAKSRKT